MQPRDPVPIIVVGDFLDNGKIYAYEEKSEGGERMLLLDLELEEGRRGDGTSFLAEHLQSGGLIRNQRFSVRMKTDGSIVSWSVLAKDVQPEVSA